MNLKGRVALVTGGSRGIGKEIASCLSNYGASVVFTYQSNREASEALVDYLKKNNLDAETYQMQVEERASVIKAITMINKRYGSIDILINNAAIAQEKPFMHINDKEWDHMLEVNLKGAFICSQEVITDMVEKKWGRIINITSIGGQWGGINQVHYAAAKAGLINLTRSLSKIYSKDGITTNAVSPGLVSTEMSEREINSNEGLEKIKNIPIGRIAKANEVAETVAFLASEQASYITGQTINVNGGMYFG